MATKTFCPSGHEYTVENTYWVTKRDREHTRQHKVCRICQRERMQRKRADPTSGYLERGRQRMARWRKAHPAEYKAAYQKVQAEKKAILDDARAGGCTVCGEKRVECLDFHHIHGKADKVGNLGTVRKFSPDRIRAEIAKCVVLCANCHRAHHKIERESVTV